MLSIVIICLAADSQASGTELVTSGPEKAICPFSGFNDLDLGLLRHIAGRMADQRASRSMLN